MRIRKISGIFLALIMAPTILCAQTSAKVSRKVLYQVSNLLDSYENLMTCDDDYAAQSFKDLFVSDQTKIYNDLEGVSTQVELSLDEYISLLLSDVKNPLFSLKNIRRSAITENDDSYNVTILFDKELIYSDDCGVLFSTKEYYKADHNMSMLITVDKKDLTAKIESLSGAIQSDQPILSENYVVLHRTSKYDDIIKCNGKTLKFNSFDQVFLPSDYTFTYDDPDMNFRVKKESNDCNILSIKYRRKCWQIVPHFDLSVGSVYDIETAPGIKLNTSSSDMTFGLDFKYFFPRLGKTKWGINLGAAYSMSKLTLKADDFKYRSATDDYFFPYTGQRYFYELHGVEQQIEFNDLVVPVALTVKRNIGKRFFLDAQVGVKGYLNLSAETTDFTGTQTAFGYNTAPNSVVTNSMKITSNQISLGTLTSTKIKPESFSLDMFSAFNFNVNITSHFGCMLGFQYQLGVLDYFKHSEGSQSLPNNSVVDGYTSLASNLSTGLFNSVEKIRRNAFHLNFGINFKF